jgi:hypothetical protein
MTNTSAKPRAIHPPSAPMVARGFPTITASARIRGVAAESNLPRRRFERKLVVGPDPERRANGREVEFDPATRKRLEEDFRLIDRAQTEAYSASHDYYLT